MKISKGSTVCVYVAMECWNSGVLKNFFCMLPQEDDLPIYFLADNCDFDPVCCSYVFKIPRLKDAVIHDVYIPREYVRGICVREGGASKEEMRMIGFAGGQRPAATNA